MCARVSRCMRGTHQHTHVRQLFIFMFADMHVYWALTSINTKITVAALHTHDCIHIPSFSLYQIRRWTKREAHTHTYTHIHTYPGVVSNSFTIRHMHFQKALTASTYDPFHCIKYKDYHHLIAALRTCDSIPIHARCEQACAYIGYLNPFHCINKDDYHDSSFAYVWQHPNTCQMRTGMRVYWVLESIPLYQQGWLSW